MDLMKRPKLNSFNYIECPLSMSRDFARSSIEILLLNLKNLDLFHCASYSGTPKDTRALGEKVIGTWRI